MAYAIALPYPAIKGVLKQDSNSDFSKMEGLFNDWYRWNDSQKVKLAPIKLYMHFKNNEFCDSLDTADKLDDMDLRNLTRNYIRKANAPKIYSFFFNLKEKISRFFGKSAERDILEKRLEAEAKIAYFSHAYLLNEKQEKGVVNYDPHRKKHFRDLKFNEKYYITGQRERGISTEELVTKCGLYDKNVVYQVIKEYNKKTSTLKKPCGRTYGKVSAEEALEISRLNKDLYMAAEAIAELKGLSGKHVVYLCNKYRKEREQREKAEKKQIALQHAEIKQISAEHIPMQIPTQYIDVLRDPIPSYPITSNYLN